MSVDKIKISSLWAIVLAGTSTQALAAYSDVSAMFDAIRPTAAVTAPELADLIAAIDALPTEQQKFDALQTLVPSADGSLRAASEGPMRQMESVLYDRLIRIKAPSSNGKETATGIASGDEAKDQLKKVDAKDAKKTTDTKNIKTSFKITITPNDPQTADGSPAPTTAATDPKAKKTSTTQATATTTTTADPAATTATDATVDTTTTTTTDTTTTVATETTTPAADAPATDELTPPTAEDVSLVEPDKGTWLQIVGNNTGQDHRYNVPGYDADVLGLLIGRDHLFSDNFMVGVAGGYVHADVDSRNSSGSFLDIKRFQLTLYAGLKFESPFFINGSATLAYNDYDNNRNILVPGADPFVRIAWADFGAWETNAHIEGGYNWVCGNFHAIPKMMLTYSHFNINGYFERDAFGLDLDAKYEDMMFIPLGLGLKAEYQNEFENAYVIPELHAYAFHDFKHDAQTAKAIFTAGGFDFLSSGAEPASNSYEVGAGIAVHSNVNTAVIIQYDYAARRDYHRNCAFIKVRHEWA